MKVFTSIDDVKGFLKDGVLAIGNFDGVHLGHRALINKALDLSNNNPCGVLTFSPHPNEFFKQGKHFYLTSDPQKVEIIKAMGVDALIVHRIEQNFLRLSPDDFVRDILVAKIGMKQVVVGHDFTFGKDRSGGVSLLRKMSESFGFDLHLLPDVIVDGDRCSSSAIRDFLHQGLLTQGNAMLGRPFSLRGMVRSGQKKGGILGFRTANLTPDEGFGLKRGVYASVLRIFDAHGHTDLIGVTNVGVRPTLSTGGSLVVETHCLSKGELELYDREIEVFFVSYLREEQRFPTVMALQEQVQKDCQRVRQMQTQFPDRFSLSV
jgi:riboflavin kinase/FMN adenylyltransferase